MEIICKNCGSIDNYRTEKKANNLVAHCKDCGKFIKNIPYTKPAIHFGKYKGTEIADFTTPEMMNYLHWVLRKTNPNPRLKDAICGHLGIRGDVNYD